MVRPDDPDWHWAVEWDDLSYKFRHFSAARDWLANELMWLAEDLHDDLTWRAWERVVKWELYEGKRFFIRAGKPPGTYRLRPRRPNEY